MYTHTRETDCHHVYETGAFASSVFGKALHGCEARTVDQSIRTDGQERHGRHTVALVTDHRHERHVDTGQVTLFILSAANQPFTSVPLVISSTAARVRIHREDKSFIPSPLVQAGLHIRCEDSATAHQVQLARLGSVFQISTVQIVASMRDLEEDPCNQRAQYERRLLHSSLQSRL